MKTLLGVFVLAAGCGAVSAAEPAPVVVAAVPPDYPNLPLKARVSAVVQVDVEVEWTGVPASVKARAISGKTLASAFEHAADTAARRWRFAPLAERNDALRRATLTFVFKARENDAPVVNGEQHAQHEVVFKPPYEIELTAAPYVCYTPGEIKARGK